jgi:hypothetical protein
MGSGLVIAADTIHALQICSTMKTATVRELRNGYTQLLKWLDAGERLALPISGIRGSQAIR